jgi:hypothetical protein
MKLSSRSAPRRSPAHNQLLQLVRPEHRAGHRHTQGPVATRKGEGCENSSLLFTQPTSTHGLVHRAGPYDEALHKEVERLEVVSAPESRDASVDADGGDCSERRRYEAPGQGAVRL